MTQTTPPNFSLPRVAELMGIVSGGHSFWETMSIVAYLIGTATVAIYADPLSPGGLQRFGLLFAISAGAWMGGATLGFLFGVPRYKSADGTSAVTAAPQAPAAQAVMAFSPNTNLEQISDWLTKIIVGATLVQLVPIVQGFAGLCLWIAVEMKQPPAAVFAGGILVFFFFAGFMWGYLWCSIRIFREMVRLTAHLNDPEAALAPLQTDRT
jgi:hypothetical protein